MYLLNPVIRNEPFIPAVFDTVTTTLIGELEIDDQPVEIETCAWKILDNQNQTIPFTQTQNKQIKWVPPAEGVFVLEVTVSSGNKTVRQIMQVQALFSVVSLHNLLTGEWQGTSNAAWFSQERIVRFQFQPDGHYAASVLTEPLLDYEIYTVLDNGDDQRDHEQKKIVIENIKDNGYAEGYINFVHQSFGELLSYGIDNLQFSDDYNTLWFNSGAWIGEQQPIRFQLTRENQDRK